MKIKLGMPVQIVPSKNIQFFSLFFLISRCEIIKIIYAANNKSLQRAIIIRKYIVLFRIFLYFDYLKTM